MISELMLLGFGVLLGVRHAMDPDHVIAVSTIASGERSVSSAARVGALWGVGHTATIFALGSVIIMLRLAVPPVLELSMELAVAAMLIVLGLAALTRKKAGGATARLSAARPLLVGSIHGLAGSAAAALMVLALIDAPVWASLYLIVFGAGTVAGMIIVTVAISFSLRWHLGRFAGADRLVVFASGAASVLLGIFMVHRVGIVHGLFTGGASWAVH